LKDAPALSQVKLLPDRDLVNEAIRFNRAYRKHLEERLIWETDKAESIQNAIIETQTSYQVWSLIQDAKCDFYFVTVRRQAMQRLREMLPEGDFDIGKMPPFVPYWRFNKLKQ